MPTDTAPILTITGRQIALGPLAASLLPFFLAWFNDLDVTRTYGVRKSPITAERLAAWYDQITTDVHTVSFAVYEVASLRPIGYTMLVNINHFERLADYDTILGAKDCWGQGYGTEATQLTLDYGFTILGLHNIMLTVRSYNERGIRAYTRAGFRPIGRRREARRMGGQAYDLIYMDCLASEFQSPVLQRLIPPADIHEEAR
jgi:diamine N-acetyltransferase